MPTIFSDNMVLQQKTKNAIWGWAEPGEKVTINASWGATSTVVTGSNGKWKLLLDTPNYGTDFTLTVRGNNTVKINNVAVGEVWLCAGQSNMGWSLGNTFNGEDEAASANYPNYRIFKSAREHWHEPLDIPRDRLAKWKPCTPQSAAATSAVSYYFGKKLHTDLNVPIGIIVQAFAGTPIEGWMPYDIQKHDPKTQQLINEKNTASERLIKNGVTPESAITKFNQELSAYNDKIDRGETMKNAYRTLTPPIITKPANMGHQYPGHIYNAMIYPIRPYGIRGAIWYQGERNSKTVPQALNYKIQLPLMINHYRSSWHELSDGNIDDEFPFYFTQLPSWNPPQTEPVEGIEATWAVNREMMRLVDNELPNTGMAVSIDTGDAIALHPKNKKPIGLRLAYLALNRTYGKDLVSSGPHLIKQTIDGATIVLHFDSIGSGLMAGKKGPLNTFAIAGKDRRWHWADAAIINNTVTLSSHEVKQPVAARYAWAMNPSQRNLLYNKEGIPASPFRTDDWPLFSSDDEAVIVNKPKKPKSYKPVDWNRPEMKQ
ncbi:sialate O-acetylesterase [Poriferisphaera sp. WC338]|uniref:sialate O-acetylesterase n=1 Tax=Poriferisphaera sp. WC338 TaxID=3425129 RepID=UPI003D81A8CD